MTPADIRERADRLDCFSGDQFQAKLLRYTKPSTAWRR